MNQNNAASTCAAEVAHLQQLQVTVRINSSKENFEVSIAFLDADVAKLSACAGECKGTNPQLDAAIAWPAAQANYEMAVCLQFHCWLVITKIGTLKLSKLNANSIS